MRRQFIVGNWKMNTTRDAGEALLGGIIERLSVGQGKVDIAVCPPYPYLQQLASRAAQTPVKVGAQNVSQEAPGAFTGEIACEMLKDVGCPLVILGHSERRQILRETDAIINLKVKRSLASGLQVILCVGETLEERESGKTDSVLQTQMAGGLQDVAIDNASIIVIAYEPVWAIGTGKVATVEQAELAHATIRAWLTNRYGENIAQQIRILYGGSVKPDNAAGLLSQPNVDGALVGGASLKADSFMGIVEAAAKL